MTRNQDHEAYSKKKLKTCANDGPPLWSDLHHDVLILVIMQLGFVDFPPFSGVCKSWRSFALSNRHKFFVSGPPISIHISTESDEKDCYCYLEDFEGRRLKTILPHSAYRTCIGFTCGYVVLTGSKTNDFWLVNLITRHELHFTDIPTLENDDPTSIRAILVYSPSISGLVLVVLNTFTTTIFLSVAGTRSWNHVTSTFPLHDIYAFKGNIYIITRRRLCELGLDPEPKLTLIESKNYPKPGHCLTKFVNVGESLFVTGRMLGHPCKLHELDLGEMEWVSPAIIVEKYDFFVRDLKYGFAIKPESWADPRSQYER